MLHIICEIAMQCNSIVLCRGDRLDRIEKSGVTRSCPHYFVSCTPILLYYFVSCTEYLYTILSPILNTPILYCLLYSILVYYFVSCYSTVLLYSYTAHTILLSVLLYWKCYKVSFSLGLPLKFLSTEKLISAGLDVSRTIYVNVDSSNLGFPYLNFLGEAQWKKNTLY